MKLLKMPPCTVSPFPNGARYETSIGPRCLSPSDPSRFGAVAEYPKTSESLPACTVSSVPQRDDGEAAFLRYSAVMFKFASFTRKVVPRLRKRRFAGSLKSGVEPKSMKPPYCQVLAEEL